MEDLEIGASGRTDAETTRKENPLDFALWKAAKEGEISWDSPMGTWSPWLAHQNVPLWRLEILGDTIDIVHGGGQTWNFHTIPMKLLNQAKTGKTFANYWMHNGFVNVDNERNVKIFG